MANTHSLDLEAGSSQYASIADGSQTGLDITGNITLEAWMKVESNPSSGSFYVICGKWRNNGANQRSYMMIYRNNGGDFQLELVVSNDGTANETLAKNIGSQLAVWSHVAISWVASTSTATFYVNGVSQGTAVGAITSLFNSNEDFSVGAGNIQSGSPTNPFDGLVDEIRVWNTNRSGTDISNNYQKELVGNETNLQAYYRFNNNYNDQTSNANNLTAVNSPVFSTDVPFVGSTTTTLNLSDTVSIREIFTRAWTAIRGLANEIVGVFERLTRAWTLSRANNETVTITEIIAAARFILIDVLERIGITEAFSRTVTWVRTFNESFGILDILTRVRMILLTEFVSITETFTPNKVINIVIREIVSIIEYLRLPLNWLKRTVPTSIWTPRTPPSTPIWTPRTKP